MTIVEKVVDKCAGSIGKLPVEQLGLPVRRGSWETIFGVFVERLAARGEVRDAEEPAKLGGTTLRLIVENLH